MKTSTSLVLRLAEAKDRPGIFELRHAVFAAELGQHPVNGEGQLSDSLDAFNVYLVLMAGEQLAGFVSITPPGHASYSVDKYIPRDELPFGCDDGLFEIRLLTVAKAFRHSHVNLALMNGALRWIEERGGTHVMAIGRQDLLGLYLKTGLKSHGREIHSGALTFELMSAPVAELRAHASAHEALIQRTQSGIEWGLPFPHERSEPCFHGGQFFAAIGVQFDDLGRHKEIVNADVLDAWFPPAPTVTEALTEHLPWILRTSPPTHCEGMVAAIAKARGIPGGCVVPGAGSSDLIFNALPAWLSAESRVLILDPMYGEYAFILEQRIGCRVERLQLSRDRNYDIQIDELECRLAEGYDMVLLVNPNSPTGRHMEGELLEKALRSAPEKTLFWIDETYVDYVDSTQSLERFASLRPNVVVCKSMSKAYALSGTRVAYLCTARERAQALRHAMRPWAVGLPGQIAAVKALESTDYYQQRWEETTLLRNRLVGRLRGLGFDVIDGVANFLLCHSPHGAANAAQIVECCREQRVYLRDVSGMGSDLGSQAFRVAVKDFQGNARIVRALELALGKR